MPRNAGVPSIPNVKCSACGKDIRGAASSTGGKVLEAWHEKCSPYRGKGLKK